jgi:hypothetical protein
MTAKFANIPLREVEAKFVRTDLLEDQVTIGATKTKNIRADQTFLCALSMLVTWRRKPDRVKLHSSFSFRLAFPLWVAHSTGGHWEFLSLVIHPPLVLLTHFGFVLQKIKSLGC